MSEVVSQLYLLKKRTNKQNYAVAYVSYLTYAANSSPKTPSKDLREFLPFPFVDQEATPSIYEKSLSREGIEELRKGFNNRMFSAKTHALLVMYEKQSRQG